MNQDKRIRWSWDYLASFSEDENFIVLSEKEIQFLLTPLSSAQWRTRWLEGIPSEDTRENFIASLQERLLTPLDICQLIADCINDPNSPARQALKDALSDTENPVLPPGTSPVNPNTIIDPTPSSNNLLIDCDPDKIYGLCVQIVDFTDSLITDALQLIETASNAVEATIIVTDDIPILGQSLDMLDFVLETGAELYASGFTIEKRQELICDLFCLGQSNCALSIADIADYFFNLYSSTYPSSVDTLLTQLALIASGEDMVNGLFSLCWAVFSAGEKWLGVQNVEQIAMIAASFNNDPDGDWTTLCEDCPNIIADYDHILTSGTPIETSGLDTGKTYRIDFLGTGGFNGANSICDAFYYDNDNPTFVTHTAFSSGYGFEINAAQASPYPSFNSEATGAYSIFITGVSSITTQVVDNPYTDNYGTINVKIFEV